MSKRWWQIVWGLRRRPLRSVLLLQRSFIARSCDMNAWLVLILQVYAFWSFRYLQRPSLSIVSGGIRQKYLYHDSNPFRSWVPSQVFVRIVRYTKYPQREVGYGEIYIYWQIPSTPIARAFGGFQVEALHFMVLSLRTASLDRSRRDLVHIGLGKVDIVWAPNLYPGAIMLSMARRDSLHTIWNQKFV